MCQSILLPPISEHFRRNKFPYHVAFRKLFVEKLEEASDREKIAVPSVFLTHPLSYIVGFYLVDDFVAKAIYINNSASMSNGFRFLLDVIHQTFFIPIKRLAIQ